MAVTVRLNQSEIQRFIRANDGPVARDLLRRGERVRQLARQKVGVSQGNGPHLRDTIVKRLVQDAQGPAVHVGTFAPKEKVQLAFWHHQGTEPHVILPRRASLLVFYWPRVDRVVYLRKVQHPGTKPNPYLVDALREGIRG